MSYSLSTHTLPFHYWQGESKPDIITLVLRLKECIEHFFHTVWTRPFLSSLSFLFYNDQDTREKKNLSKKNPKLLLGTCSSVKLYSFTIKNSLQLFKGNVAFSIMWHLDLIVQIVVLIVCTAL